MVIAVRDRGTIISPLVSPPQTFPFVALLAAPIWLSVSPTRTFHWILFHLHIAYEVAEDSFPLRDNPLCAAAAGVFCVFQTSWVNSGWEFKHPWTRGKRRWRRRGRRRGDTVTEASSGGLQKKQALKEELRDIDGGWWCGCLREV